MIKSTFSWFSISKRYLRPPGAIKENDFIKKCIHCSKCAQICPYDSISFITNVFSLSNSTPVIEARKIPCYVCMKCTQVCPTGALKENITQKEQVKMGVARINEEQCLPFMGVICRACFENCPIYREAIFLEDDLYPKVNEEKCIGCGICEHVCPVENSAIIVEPIEEIV